MINGNVVAPSIWLMRNFLFKNIKRVRKIGEPGDTEEKVKFWCFPTEVKREEIPFPTGQGRPQQPHWLWSRIYFTFVLSLHLSVSVFVSVSVCGFGQRPAVIGDILAGCCCICLVDPSWEPTRVDCSQVAGEMQDIKAVEIPRNILRGTNSDLICQAGSLCPRMATVWKGSRPSSIRPLPTARTLLHWC